MVESIYVSDWVGIACEAPKISAPANIEPPSMAAAVDGIRKAMLYIVDFNFHTLSVLLPVLF